MSWVFVLGILVGRGFLPEGVATLTNIKGRINKLQGIVGHNRESRSEPQNNPEPDPKLAFYEKLSTKKYEAKNTQPGGGGVDPGNRKKSKKAEPKQEMSPKSTASNRQKDNEKRRGGSETGLRQLGNPVGETLYTVQLASLGDKKKAEDYIEDLIARGYPGYYYKVKVEGRIYYRIRCGRFDTWRKATTFARKLRKETGIKGFVSKVE